MLYILACILISTLFSPSISVTLTCSAPDSCSDMDLSQYTTVKCTGSCSCQGLLTFNNATSSLTISSEFKRIPACLGKKDTRVEIHAATNFGLVCKGVSWACPRWVVEALGVSGKVDIKCSASGSCNAMKITTVSTTDTLVDCQQGNPCTQIQLNATNVQSSVSLTCSAADACGSTDTATISTIFTSGKRADIICEEGDTTAQPSCFGTWEVLPGSLAPQFVCTPNGFVNGPVCGDLVINGNVSVACERRTATNVPNHPVCLGVSVKGSNVDITCRDSSSGSHVVPACKGLMRLEGSTSTMTCAAAKACGNVTTPLIASFHGPSNSMICPSSGSCSNTTLRCSGQCICAGPSCSSITWESQAPTSVPTTLPSAGPSSVPSNIPTVNPSIDPSQAPTVAPSDSPTDGPSSAPSISPTNAPTGHPVTSGPSNEPTSNPTKNPSMAPIHSPTKSPSSKGPTLSPTQNNQVSAAQVSTINQIVRFDTQTQAMVGVIAFLSLFMIIGTLHHCIVGGFVLRHKRMLSYAIMSFDFFTDVLFSFVLFEHLPESADLFAVSAVTIILPLIMSLIAWPYEVRIWKNERVYFYPKFVVWFEKNSILLYLLSVLSGSTFGAVQLQNSGLFGLSTFTMNAPRYYVDLYDRKRLYLCVVFENIPQLVVQILWAVRSPTRSGFVLFAAMLTSGLSLIGSIYLGCVKQMRGSALRKYVGMYELTLRDFQRIVDKSLRSISERVLAEEIKEIIMKHRLSEIGQIYDVHVIDFGVRHEVDRVFRVALFVEAFFDSSKEDVMKTMKEMAYDERNLTKLAKFLLQSDSGELDVEARLWRCEDMGVETRTFRTDSVEMFSSLFTVGSITPQGEEVETRQRKSILNVMTDTETRAEGEFGDGSATSNM